MHTGIVLKLQVNMPEVKYYICFVGPFVCFEVNKSLLHPCKVYITQWDWQHFKAVYDPGLLLRLARSIILKKGDEGRHINLESSASFLDLPIRPAAAASAATVSI